jgi:hypothetical protein
MIVPVADEMVSTGKQNPAAEVGWKDRDGDSFPEEDGDALSLEGV